MEFTDDLGAAVGLSEPPARVVSLVPSLTEAVAVSAPETLAGATDYCIHPAGLDVPRIGGSKYPRVAEVIALRPDLVLANYEENREPDVLELRAAGIPVWVTAAPATVPAALDSVGRLLQEAFWRPEPDWIGQARTRWAHPEPHWATAVIPVWRRPWVLVGRDTFAGDVLHRLGVANAYGGHEERYPRPPLEQVHALLAEGKADLVVLPDEPYLFTATDGPEAFPDTRCVLLSGRHLTWHGPSLVQAHEILSTALHQHS